MLVLSNTQTVCSKGTRQGRKNNQRLPRVACANWTRALAQGLIGLACTSAVAWAQSGADFGACLAELARQAPAAQVQAATFARYTQELQPDMSLLNKLNYQPEFQTPIWDYMAGLVDEERVRDGLVRLEQEQVVLSRVQRQFGVDPATVVAVWGIESDYGRNMGKVPIVQALATLSCMGRRQTFFRGQLMSALRILQGGHMRAERMIGSWAGAFGHTQFIPTTWEMAAVDMDGDGRKDLQDSIADALGSTAHYLNKSGWRSGLAWGLEVQLPSSLNASALAGRNHRRSLSWWQQQGVTQVDGQPLSARADLHSDTPLGLLLLAGVKGPAFLVSRNFDALYSYNAAESYGLAIAQLADRLRGGPAIQTPWPTDDPGLSRDQRRELQILLLSRGHAIGEADGALGDKSRAAIRVEQQRLGLDADGRGGQRILRALRAEK